MNKNLSWYDACKEIIDRCVAPDMYAAAMEIREIALRAELEARTTAAIVDTPEFRAAEAAAGIEYAVSRNSFIAYISKLLSTPAAPVVAASDLHFRSRVADLLHLLPMNLEFEERDKATAEKVLADVRAGLHAAPVVAEGWQIVPIKPNEDMVVDGFESCPDPVFSSQEDWDRYDAMSGCQQASQRARLCYAAMLAAAPAYPFAPAVVAKGLDADQLETLVREYGNTPTAGNGRTRRDVMLDIIWLVARPAAHPVAGSPADDDQMTKQESDARMYQFLRAKAKERGFDEPLDAIFAGSPAEAHPDDVAVAVTAVEMKAKMKASREKGRGGWDDPAQCTTDDLADMLVEHVHRGDPMDVLLLAMMLVRRGAVSGELVIALEAFVSAQSRKPRPAAAPVPASEAASVPVGEVVENANGTWGVLFDGCHLKAGTKLFAAPAAPTDANNYHDAYRGARDDLQDWKRRALSAEASCLRMTAALNEENGPTFMGEPAPAAQSVRDAALASCSPEEIAAFEAWADGAKYDMTTHPLHWLFLNERTYAARQGWKAALDFARVQSPQAPGKAGA